MEFVECTAYLHRCQSQADLNFAKDQCRSVTGFQNHLYLKLQIGQADFKKAQNLWRLNLRCWAQKFSRLEMSVKVQLIEQAIAESESVMAVMSMRQLKQLQLGLRFKMVIENSSKMKPLEPKAKFAPIINLFKSKDQNIIVRDPLVTQQRSKTLSLFIKLVRWLLNPELMAIDLSSKSMDWYMSSRQLKLVEQGHQLVKLRPLAMVSQSYQL